MNINEKSSATPAGRRPIKARGSRWAAGIAAMLAGVPVKPNTISIFSVVFAGIAGACFAATAWPRAASSASVVAMLFVCGALCVQMRLLCNLFDGMVAVEGGFQTKSGEIFNELPDRFADALVLIGLGYAADVFRFGMELGYVAAVLAVITAYVRALGAAAGAGHHFMGPMAKQHRMAAATIASLLSAVAAFWSWQGWVAVAALGVMIAGMLVTIARRARRVVRVLENK
ncbi:CDP-alcohol phosphatidyltransferase family protein [Termitidicoccus mucosus]|uniref:CDP-alcohol phosphatidyltransferase n=1 Tax=Termitidicoccus mucosus TaxID=1184151 RepID=A0A178IIJ0_9BACT|nr:hypothetical protein AW736_08870 [Opitutaceae bacterium TSB47]